MSHVEKTAKRFSELVKNSGISIENLKQSDVTNLLEEAWKTYSGAPTSKKKALVRIFNFAKSNNFFN